MVVNSISPVITSAVSVLPFWSVNVILLPTISGSILKSRLFAFCFMVSGAEKDALFWLIAKTFAVVGNFGKSPLTVCKLYKIFPVGLYPKFKSNFGKMPKAIVSGNGFAGKRALPIIDLFR